MNNPLSGKFEFNQLCRFAWPTIIMLVFMSLYSMVDGAFVARLIGTDALSAVNIIFPLLNVYYAIGIMLATGSGAVVATLMGEGRNREARENFTFMIAVSIAAGLLFSLAAWLCLDHILRLLGAGGDIQELCRGYALPLLPFVPAAMLQMMFQTYFVAAGRPGFGLAAVVMGGLTNVLLDYVFIAVMDMGIGGAALATGLGYTVPAALGLLYFAGNRGGTLRFARPRLNWPVLASSMVNGSSEMVTNLSAAVVIYLFNMSMLHYVGVDGVAAITIVLYAEFLLSSIYYGFSAGVSPVFSYKYGKGDSGQLKRMFRNSLFFITICSVVAVAASQTLAGPIVSIFAPVGGDVHEYAVNGFRMFSMAFVFMGFNVFASALFTALSNGKISALLSFLRFLFIAVSILFLPRVASVDGIWLAVPMAEVLSLGIGAFYLHRLKSVYQYA